MNATTTTIPVSDCTFRAMASAIALTVVDPGPSAASALGRAEAAIREVEATCSRFDPASALSRANAAPDEWHVVPAATARAVGEAARAYIETGGLFDPRVLQVLLRWGYDRTLPFEEGFVHDGAAGRPGLSATEPHGAAPGPWAPQILEHDGVWQLHLGGQPIDLGGIGKGLAVRWAAAELAAAGRGFLVDAGGDVAVGGVSPDGGRWRVGIEDPAGGPEPVLVLEVTDTGCATSSTRLRRWRSGGEQVHHLVDPRTGRPGGVGLASVTVLHPDPASAEMWAKALFLSGADGIRAAAGALGAPAAWVGVDGSVGTSAAMNPLVTWRRDHG